ncbi:protein kinase [Kitasatospora sp. NPDC056531]|uniref:protein kinase domain-containing protein n=1 Tax=Kitasatospora sp. NPDC056531 TaxID=3345856 RepID=UPI0036AACE71
MVLALLGRGGMAEVHLARDQRLDRLVAVKALRPDLATDPTSLLRFRREALSTASLNHSSIVAVFDSGEEALGEGVLPYLVMEYVQGCALDEMLRQGPPLPAERALELTLGVLEALERAHAQGIVHRDVKPANVMVTWEGRTKVMDFGIAQLLTTDAMALTQGSVVIGTAAYLSPEQARGESVDVRSDLYSAGCLLYELLTGRPPFTGETPIAVAWQHVNEEPRPPSAYAPELPDVCDGLVLPALAKDRHQRYQTATEMRIAVAHTLAAVVARTHASDVFTTCRTPPVSDHASAPVEPAPGRVQRTRGPQRGRRARRVVLAVVLCAAVCAAAGAYSAAGSPPGGRAVRMPDLAGKSVADARLSAQSSGLRVSRVVEGACPTPGLPVRRVCGQLPASGDAVTRGSAVVIDVPAPSSPAAQR